MASRYMEVRGHNVGNSDYSRHSLQPWDIWLKTGMNAWDADVCKRILRKKKGEEPTLDYEKIKHIAAERMRQISEKEKDFLALEKQIKTEYKHLTEEDLLVIHMLLAMYSGVEYRALYQMMQNICDNRIEIISNENKGNKQ